MGLSVALGNALSGMGVSQKSLEILSRNVANSGTAGYHRQALIVVDSLGQTSVSARAVTATRAFNASLQSYHTSTTSDAAYSNIKAEFLGRLQTYLGVPGESGSLDTAFNDFQSALGSLATSPDDYSTRADVIAQAQAMVSTLNSLSDEIQTMRQEAESKIASHVSTLNQKLNALKNVNTKLTDQTIDADSRASLLDERDRMVAEVSEIVDVTANYRSDGSVALMTRSGIGLLDINASVFKFQSAGGLSANAVYSADNAESGVGELTLTTPAGLTIDLVEQNVFQSGELTGLIELRDETLVQAQNQLDEIAAALAQSLSTIETEGTAVTSGTQVGYALDLSGIRSGNDFVLNYSESGVERSVKVVRVDDTGNLPIDYVDAEGNRVIGLDFSGGAASVASELGSILGGLAFSGAGQVLQVLDDGSSGTIDVSSLAARTTVTSTQGAGLGLSLLVDTNNTAFTNSLDGVGQKRGFASRISLNSAVLADNSLLVRYESGGSLGDASRAQFLVEQLDSMRFSSTEKTSASQGSFRLNGTVSDMISQTIDFQGGAAAAALDAQESDSLAMEALSLRLDDEYGVDVDEEMARLLELQNAYAANSRIISVVQELMNMLLQL